jgi:hypothetical protein
MPAAIGGVSSLCIGSSTTLTDAVPGGIWTSTPITVATIGSTSGVVTGVSAGVVFVTYSIGSCSVLKKISIIPCAGFAPERSLATTDLNGQTTASFRLFPNPSSGSLSISWEDQIVGNAVIALSDVTGREVKRLMISNSGTTGTQQIDLSELKDGIYLVTIKSESVHYNSKIFIQH